MRGFFNEEGTAFARYYYDGDAPSFPSDIDDHALSYFGATQYYSEEFDDEAYLFVPFDERLYREMAAIIERRWDAWKRNGCKTEGNVKMNENEEPSDVAVAIMQYLNCGRADCSLTYFPPMEDDDPITAAYGYAVRRGVRDGFVPVLIVPSDTLWEILTMNAGAEKGDFEDYDFDAEAVKKYREKILSESLPDGKATLTERLGERFEQNRAETSDEEESAADCFISYWDYETQETQPLILAKIPVKNPWEIFAYLPFGGWNDCPDTAALMAVSKYWHEQHGAMPAVLTYDTIEYSVPAPIAPAHAKELAVEQYAFCADIVEQGAPGTTVGKLAERLKKSNIWYFWWD